MQQETPKSYLVVGASSGIGAQTAAALLQQGHRVFGTFNKTLPALEASALFAAHHLDVLEDHLDLDYLPEALDGLLYCPGSINLKPFARITPSEFRSDLDLQLLGAIKIIQAILPRLKRGKQASIVLFSSVAATTGFPFHTQVAVSKGAVEGLTKSLAAELAPTMRVNCIAPSLTATPLAARLINSPEKIEANAQRHPLKRIGEAQDLAAMATFLLSDEASWITGQILHVDGGMSTLRV
jgi:NAD(P)-dependent dehydrogenase (short-subunit alcohol dehydrogenase family)